MAKNNQKLIIIVIVVLLIMTSLLAVFISLNIEDNDNGNSGNNNSSKPIINKEISRLNDTDEYFAAQNTINYFYDVREQNNAKELLTLLNEEYVNSNEITEANILDYIVLENDNINFHASEIYYNAESNITYYFMKGYIVGDSFIKEDTYDDNIYFLVIVDMDNNYSIMPLSDINNIEEYAKSYDIKETYIDNNTLFTETNLEEQDKIINYINNYSDLMFLDVDKAYNMLDDNTKEIYLNKNIFADNITNIYEKLFTSFYATSSKENTDNIVYKVQNHDGDTITITEYYPNDYKIGFNFVGGE